jgi:hypothetical protein
LLFLLGKASIQGRFAATVDGRLIGVIAIQRLAALNLAPRPIRCCEKPTAAATFRKALPEILSLSAGKPGHAATRRTAADFMQLEGSNRKKSRL